MKRKTKKVLVIMVLWIILGIICYPAESKKDLRLVRILAMVDSENWPNSSKHILGAITYASAILEKNFHITLVIIAVQPWNALAEKQSINTDIVYPEIKQLARNKETDVIAFYTPKPLFRTVTEEIDGDYVPTPQAIYGCAEILGSVALVRINESTNRTTLHELLHLFGAEDIFEGNTISIMKRLDTDQIDPENFRVVLKNRLRDFSHKPLGRK